jgi:hypothetical protein
LLQYSCELRDTRLIQLTTGQLQLKFWFHRTLQKM